MINLLSFDITLLKPTHTKKMIIPDVPFFIERLLHPVKKWKAHSPSYPLLLNGFYILRMFSVQCNLRKGLFTVES